MQKFVACLYFIVDAIVLMIAEILLFRLWILAKTDRKLSPKSSEEHSCLGALVYWAKIRLVCGFWYSNRVFFIQNPEDSKASEQVLLKHIAQY